MLVHDVGTGTLATLASSPVLFQSGELTQFAGRAPTLVGGRDWAGPDAANRLYECADGWLMVAARDAAECRALAAFGGLVDVGTDANDTLAARVRDGARRSPSKPRSTR